MAKPTMSGFLRGYPAPQPQPAPATPQQFPPNMPFDAFGFLPPGVQLPGETTIAPMLREVEDMRRANQGMLGQIESDTFDGPIMRPRGVWEEPSVALNPNAPTQRTVPTIPVGPSGTAQEAAAGPPEDPLVPPTQRSPAQTVAAGGNPLDPEAIIQQAGQAQVASNPGAWAAQVKAEPTDFQKALASGLMSSKAPQMPKVGEGLDWALTPTRPRRQMEQPQPNRLAMPTMAGMLRGA
jgi:hypothetical protein